MHKEYEADQRLNPDAPPYVKIDTFRRSFHSHPDLADVQISDMKRTFGRCPVCRRGEKGIASAIRKGDPERYVREKAERKLHLVRMRMEKLNYYFEREMARSPVALKITLIIDKMDQAKNNVPCFSTRLPKDLPAKVLDHLLPMHIVGVIIHGQPDRRYFFVVYPHLAGDSNLNLECIRLALVADSKITGNCMRVNLGVWLDNASDNKSRFTVSGLAWLVGQAIVNQVEVAMLPVGHTHEDIDQAFRVIANALIRASFVGTIDQYIEIIATAWTGERQHVEVVSAVHDYTSWVKGSVWETSHSSDPSVNSLKHLKKNRYYVIRKRASDGAVCLWYKPEPMHDIMYPVEKDALGDPVVTMRADGTEEFFTDKNGIEVFRTVEGLKGHPQLAQFPSKPPQRMDRCTKCVEDNDDQDDEDDDDDSLPCEWDWDDLSGEQRAWATLLGYDSDSWYDNTYRSITWKALMAQADLRVAAISLGFTADTWNADPVIDQKLGKERTFVPRMDAAETLAAVRFLLDNHRDEWFDPDADREWWESWAAGHPTSVDDVLPKPQWEWPEGCENHQRDLPAELKKSSTTFMETIEYRNVIQACELNTAQLEQNLSDYGERSGKYTPMTKGTFIWTKRETDGQSDPGWNTPLWCARLRSDEDPDVEDPDDEDTFEIEWWGCFHYDVLRDSMNHTFKPICSGWRPGPKGDDGKETKRFHAFKSSCTGCGHGLFLDTIKRAQIRLTTHGTHTLTSKGLLSGGIGCDARSRLASVLKQDGFEVSDYLSGDFKSANGRFRADYSGERLWESAAKAATEINRKMLSVAKRKLE